MKLTTKSRYGSRILIDLASYGRDGPISVGDISKRQNIPVKYLEQIIRPLKKAGMVTSVRGAKGGHMLAKNAEEITLGEIVRLFETQTDLVACVSEPNKCLMTKQCKLRLAWQAATDALYNSLDSFTIADLKVS